MGFQLIFVKKKDYFLVKFRADFLFKFEFLDIYLHPPQESKIKIEKDSDQW